MDLIFSKSHRRFFALVVFGLFLAWPIIHMVMIKSLHMSSWRFFGWGMYATPLPEAQSRLRVVIRDKSASRDVDIGKLYNALAKASLDPAQESRCINLFLEEPLDKIRKLPKTRLCQNNAAARNLEYFMHLRSPKHLTRFIKEALFVADRLGSETYAFFTHQRFNLFKREAYLESDVYRVMDDNVQYLGKIDDEGEMREEQHL